MCCTLFINTINMMKICMSKPTWVNLCWCSERDSTWLKLRRYIVQRDLSHEDYGPTWVKSRGEHFGKFRRKWAILVGRTTIFKLKEHFGLGFVVLIRGILLQHQSIFFLIISFTILQTCFRLYNLKCCKMLKDGFNMFLHFSIYIIWNIVGCTRS